MNKILLLDVPRLAPQALRLLRSGAMVSLITLYTGILAQYALHFFAARELGAEKYGYFALGLSIISIGAMTCQLGFNRAVIKLIGVYNARHEYGLLLGILRGTFLLVLSFGSIVAITAFGIVTYFSEPNPQNSLQPLTLMLQLTCIAMPCVALLLLVQNMARGLHSVIVANLPYNTVLPLIALGYMVVMINQPIYAYHLIGVYGLSAIILTVLVYLYIIRLPKIQAIKSETKRYEYYTWLKTAIPIGIFTFFNQLLQRGDILILALFLPAQSVGIYALASRLSQVVTLANRAFNRYWAPKMAEHHAVNNKKSLQQVITKTARFTFLSVAMTSLILIVFGNEIIPLFGKDFNDTYGLMVIFLFGKLLKSYFAPSIMLLQMADQEKLATRLLLLIGSMVLIAHFIIIPNFGTTGAVIVTTLGTMFLTIATVVASKLRINCYTGAF